MMIILIGGETHSGKTLMAHKMLERLMIPYTSLDHIKMGLIRGMDNCGFKISDGDEYISQKMWGIVKGIIDTCEENEQNIILEGVYLPPEKVCGIVNENICAVYIILSREYIENSFDSILSCESVIEKRLSEGDFEVGKLIMQNESLRGRCEAAGLKYVMVKNDYAEEIKEAYSFVEEFAAHAKINRRCNG